MGTPALNTASNCRIDRPQLAALSGVGDSYPTSPRRIMPNSPSDAGSGTSPTSRAVVAIVKLSNKSVLVASACSRNVFHGASIVTSGDRYRRRRRVDVETIDP